MPLSDAAVERLREAADAPDLTGTKYELVDRVAHGGMATVYRARDRELGRDVALKVVRLPEATPDLAARVLREARTVARLEHPGIVPVHDVGRLADGRAYYAMKLVRGAPLDALPPTSLADRLRIIERICEAVAFAHAHGVIHRDLKPQNVMVGPFGEVLVMDWGVAKVFGDASADEPRAPAPPDALGSAAGVADHDGRTAHGVVLGTPGYMAPEQAAGDAALVGPRTDVFAIGAILRDLCALPSPAIGARDAPSRPLQAIIAKAMAADPDQRYAGPEALAADLAALRAGAPVSAYRENVLERVKRLSVKYATPLLLIVGYLLMRLTLLAVRGL